MQGFQTFNSLLTLGSQKYGHATGIDYQAESMFSSFFSLIQPCARKKLLCYAEKILIKCLF